MRLRFVLFVLLLAGMFRADLFATESTGTITGTVADASGAVVQKATVNARNQDTNVLRVALTNDDGDFTFALLPPGHYQVAVEKTGFKKSVIAGVLVQVDQTVRVDFDLQIGVPSQEVQVTATPPIIQTDTSTLGQVISNLEVFDLPLNDRNFLDFTYLVPGATLPAEGSENSTEGGALNVNGTREQSNNFVLEGVNNNDPYINQYAALPSVEAIQEFKVQSGDYSAEFGHNSGAQINVVLKSGSNAFHGDVFEFLRNRALDADNYFVIGQNPALDRDQFGATLGGPIRKDKTFFFVSYEGLHLRQATTREATVPSATDWATAQAYADLLFGCPAAPSCATGTAVMNLYPQSNVGGPAGSTETFIASPTIRQTNNLGSVKIDEHATDSDTINLHYSVFDADVFNPYDPVNAFTTLPDYGSTNLTRGQNASLGWTHAFANDKLNQFRVGFTRYRAGFFQQDQGTNINANLGYPTVLSNPLDFGAPNISVTGFSGIGDPIQYPEDRHDTTLEIADTLAWTHGRNQFKIGGNFLYTRIDDYIDFVSRGDFNFLGDTALGILQAPPPFGSGCMTTIPYPQPGSCPPMSILGLAQLLGGVPDAAVAVSGNTENSLRNISMGYFIQDDIHVVPRFLLNVGMRYEFTSAPVEANNHFSVPNLSPASANCTPMPDCEFIQADTDGVRRGIYRGTRADFGPRIGFAWRPLKTERWVVRSAYGIFYDNPISQISVFPRFNPPYYNLGLYEQNPAVCPFGLCTVQDIFNQPAAPIQATTIAPNFRDGYVQEWNADLQYEVAANWMVDAAYVGSKGTHLADVRDINQQNPYTGAVPYPEFASVLMVESEADSTYHSLQLRSNRRMGHGLEFLAAYTFSKSIDDVSAVFAGPAGSGLPQNSYDLSAERGLSDFNAKHRFSLSYVYDIPAGKFGQESGWKKGLLANWQTSGIYTYQSGNPFTAVIGGGTSSAALAFGNPARPDEVGNPFQPGPVAANPGCNGQAPPTQVGTPTNWFNPCAFMLPPDPTGIPGLYAYGTEGRNTLIGPSFNDLDFAVIKNIPLHAETHRLQIRGDAFNIFNHPNFDLPSNNLINTSFSEILSANAYGNRPPRQIQVGIRYLF